MKHGDTGLPALLEKHGEVFNGELGSMKNITVKLNIKPDSKPKLMKARPVPYAIRPKVEADLDALVNNKVRNIPQLAPLHPWDWPEEAWHRIHVDFAGPFEDRMFLVMVDAHSKWPEVAIMKSTTAGKTIEKLGEVFSRFGSPLQLVSDNGPQLVSQEMTTFLQVNGVQHIRSAPYHPSTNGLAERFVQTMKHALKASQGQGTLHQRLHSFLLSYRNTPHATTKASPASLLMKRELRTSFDLLRPPTTKEIVQRQQERQVERRGFKAKDRSLTRARLSWLGTT
ncbi:hypothetical protein DPEC_G00373820 [Dallia pectoralis]|nr:hypothetical protein DPEC_G00373820 [Dallia pectoralis]